VNRGVPSIAGLVAEGRLVAQTPDRPALEVAIDGAGRDVAAADANIRSFGPWADAMLYEAGLRSARVIVQAAGFRIDAGARAHVTAIDAADTLTNLDHHLIFVRLHRMRRRRNDFMYATTADPSDQDLAQARRDVMTLISLARRAIEDLG
jgi:hypothetical protein